MASAVIVDGVDHSTESLVETETGTRRSSQGSPRVHIVLFKSIEHGTAYVADMLMRVFKYPDSQAKLIAGELETEDQVIVWTGQKERAELHLATIVEFGPDPTIEGSKGSMRADLQST